MLGNVDANTGDAQTGWDTDQARAAARLQCLRSRSSPMLAAPAHSARGLLLATCMSPGDRDTG